MDRSLSFCHITFTHRIPRDNQRDREQQSLLKSIDSNGEYIPIWEQLARNQFDPSQVVSRQVFTLYSHLLISTAFVVVNRVGCFGVSGVLYRNEYSLPRNTQCACYQFSRYFIIDLCNLQSVCARVRVHMCVLRE